MNPYNTSDIFGGSFNASAHYDAVKVQLASPETIRSWSHGEVKNPETINYRTYRPEKEGLFCEKIFGPTKDWECACGKYKRIKNKGMVCDRCGVEVTLASVRRQRMGHIELAVPVSHIWFFKCSPSRMGLLLDKTTSELERVIYYQDWMVVEPGDTPLKEGQILSDQEYIDAQEKYADCFKAEMGAEAVRKLLKKLDLDALMKELEEQMENTRSKQNRKKIAKCMKVVEGFRVSQSKPEWMILDVLPVIPPELRPLVPLEGGRFATSDLNDLYRRVINRNNRLKNLLALKTPDVIIRNEKRMLQEAVDAVFDNGRHGRPVSGPGNRPLKSLSEILKGKTGRFRQNLLGKRVDYSGRSVIVVGPELKFPQCGIPKEMALRLFEPFIIRRLKELGICHTVRTARKMIERHDEQVWDSLEEVTKDKTVFLNRAPTLHRLSIQAFEPVLVEGKAIRLHPMVCTPFNADFDGDQMAVHVPLSVEAQMEAKLVMLATTSIFSPASGKSIVTPTQDVCLGLYFLTVPSQQDKLAGKLAGKAPAGDEHLPAFNDVAEVEFAIAEGDISYHTRIRFRNPDFGTTGRPHGVTDKRTIETTAGRVIFNNVWPEAMGFWNDKCSKSTIGNLILDCHKVAGHDVTVEAIDALKSLGYRFATISGASMGLKDMIRPSDKDAEIEKARKEAAMVQQQFQQGIITDGERHNKIVDIWSTTTEKVGDELYRPIDTNISPENKKPTELNPVYMFVDSKARGSKLQIRQLAGMRGLMANPSGDIIERPITASFREGLSVLEYFISSHGARKGLADTALKTADAGYLTRRLVDVAQDLVITEDDCHTDQGIDISAFKDGDDTIIPLEERLLGRVPVEDIKHPVTGEVIVKAGELVTERDLPKITAAGIEHVKMRSVLTCASASGVCAKCYGRMLSSGRPVDLGEAVGVIAAQSIGEPGTQLTLRTFHIGGASSRLTVESDKKALVDGHIELENVDVVTHDGNTVVVSRMGELVIYDSTGINKGRYQVPYGAILHVKDKDAVKKGAVMFEWDPYNSPIISNVDGKVQFLDLVENATYRVEKDEITEVETWIIISDKRGKRRPAISIVDAEGKKLGHYLLPDGAILTVHEGDSASVGQTLAKLPRAVGKTRDITGGLPRVAELFEARIPKNVAVIAPMDGLVAYGNEERGNQKIIIKNGENEDSVLVPRGRHLAVHEGDRVRAGQKICDGSVDPHDILRVQGPEEVQRHLVNEIQAVYRLQGVSIADKHIECIVRQMMRKVRITDPGDSDLLPDDEISKARLRTKNEKLLAEGKKTASYAPMLLGITKSSLATDSFISAASFQETTKILTHAAIEGSVDPLLGLKENVIMGRLIPCGTGARHLRNVKVTDADAEAEAEAHRAQNEDGEGSADMSFKMLDSDSENQEEDNAE